MRRQHALSEGVREYDRLRDAYVRLGYDTVILPKTDVGSRAVFVLRHLY